MHVKVVVLLLLITNHQHVAILFSFLETLSWRWGLFNSIAAWHYNACWQCFIFNYETSNLGCICHDLRSKRTFQIKLSETFLVVRFCYYLSPVWLLQLLFWHLCIDFYIIYLSSWLWCYCTSYWGCQVCLIMMGAQLFVSCFVSCKDFVYPQKVWELCAMVNDNRFQSVKQHSETILCQAKHVS